MLRPEICLLSALLSVVTDSRQDFCYLLDTHHMLFTTWYNPSHEIRLYYASNGPISYINDYAYNIESQNVFCIPCKYDSISAEAFHLVNDHRYKDAIRKFK